MWNWLGNLGSLGGHIGRRAAAPDPEADRAAVAAPGERVRLRGRSVGGRESAGALRVSRQDFEPTEGYPPGRDSLDLFVRMQRDAQVRACLTTKRLAVLSESIEVHPAGESALAKRAAAAVEEQIAALPGGAGGVVAGALDALAMGFAVGELVWAIDGTLAAVRWHDPRRFVFHASPWGDLVEVEVTDSGTRWPADRFLIYSYQSRYGNPHGEPDLVAAYRPWATKDSIRRMWLTGLDRFGVPTPVAKVPTTYSQEEADRIAAMLGGIQSQSALTLPADVELSYDLDAGRVEPARAYVTAIEYEDRQIARAILGQELTTSGDGGGSHALGDVHAGVQDDWIQALRRDLSDQPLAQLARAITLYSVGPDAPAPSVRFPNLSPTDLRARRELIEAMVKGGIVAPAEGWIRSFLGLPADGSGAHG